MEQEKRAPIIVKTISVMGFIVSGFLFLLSLAIILALSQGNDGPFGILFLLVLGPIFLFFLVVIFTLAVLNTILWIKFLKGKKWARILAIILSLLFAIFTLNSIDPVLAQPGLQGQALFFYIAVCLIIILIDAIIFVELMFNKKVKEYFNQ